MKRRDLIKSVFSGITFLTFKKLRLILEIIELFIRDQIFYLIRPDLKFIE